MVADPRDVRAAYLERAAARRRQAEALEPVSRRLSLARLGAVLLTIALAVAAAELDSVDFAWTLAPAALFVLLVVRHDRLITRQERFRRSAGLYEEGLARLSGEWVGRGPSGEGFANADHRYASDLDVLGRGSLFELLCSARTAAGQETLASWLLAPAAPDEVRRRQAAVAELAPAIDLREETALLGEDVQASFHLARVRAWAERPAVPAPGWWKLASPAATVLTLAGLGLAFATGHLAPVLLPLLLHMALRWRQRHLVGRASAGVVEVAEELAVLARLAARIESERFSSERMRAIQRALTAGGERASRGIARLKVLADRAEYRENLLFRPVDFALFWGLHVGRAIERWRARSGASLGTWSAALGEAEALLALSRAAFEHPEDVFPELVDGPPRLEAAGLAHPLLADNAVRNDVALGGQAPRVLIVSGSNMSGKSTLLRALGLNVALAQAGGVVRCRALSLTPLDVGASIRIVDSVLEGSSRFYAEVRRLKRLVDLADSGRPLLFLLDELFAGTNSHDRRIAAEALLGHLASTSALGLVTTHDLALARLEQTLGSVANVHFEDVLEADQIRFDYRLRPGTVTRSNALELMRAVGLPVPRRDA